MVIGPRFRGLVVNGARRNTRRLSRYSEHTESPFWLRNVAGLVTI